MEKVIYELRRWLSINNLSTEGVTVAVNFRSENEAFRVRAQLARDFDAAEISAHPTPPENLARLSIQGVRLRFPQVEDLPQPVFRPLPWPKKQ